MGGCQHVTHAECADAICDEGIDAEREREKWVEFNRLLATVAEEESIALPVDRPSCAFAYLDCDQGTKPTTHLSGYATFVIDLDAIDAPLYIADYSAATASFANFDDPRSSDEVARERAVEYLESMRPYNYSDETSGIDGTAELLIEGSIQSTALTYVYR